MVAAGAVGASALCSFPALLGTPNAAGVRTIYVDAVNSAVLDAAVEHVKLI